MLDPKIILTFDYELYFGKNSGSVEQCILKPTEMLRQTFRETQIKATFFVDTICIHRLLNENSQTQTEAHKIIQQLKELLKEGHRLELHLHPHWLDAKYVDGKWLFDTYEHYRLHSLNRKQINGLFEEGVMLIKNIAKEIIPNYEVLVFRAGGWCIQPFSHVKEAFVQNGIKYDSSVTPMLSAKNLDHYFDFSEAPEELWYRFEDEVTEKQTDGAFIEVPITSCKKGLLLKLFDKLYNFKNRVFGDGSGMTIKNVEDKNILAKFIRIATPYHVSLSLDYSSYFSIHRMMRRKRKRLYVFMSHPKSLSMGTNRTLRKLNKRNYDFITYQDIIEC